MNTVPAAATAIAAAAAARVRGSQFCCAAQRADVVLMLSIATATQVRCHLPTSCCTRLLYDLLLSSMLDCKQAAVKKSIPDSISTECIPVSSFLIVSNDAP
jgi:hypothetical protein